VADHGTDLGARKWVDVQRFSSIKKAISLLRAVWRREEFGEHRCNARRFQNSETKHLQTTLIEAAKMAPRKQLELAMLLLTRKAERPCQSRNTGGGAKVGGHLMAVDRGQRDFQCWRPSTLPLAA